MLGLLWFPADSSRKTRPPGTGRNNARGFAKKAVLSTQSVLAALRR